LGCKQWRCVDATQSGLYRYQAVKTPPNLRVTVAIATLIFAGLQGCTKAQPKFAAERAGALTDLKAIGLSLRGYLLELDVPLDTLLACSNSTTNVQIVSAEKVLKPVFSRFQSDESYLISPAYQNHVLPARSAATSISEKWGSSYDTWCMSADSWRISELFVWRTPDQSLTLWFPWVWDKRPDLYGGVANVLQSDGSCATVASNLFYDYLEAAHQWVQPSQKSNLELINDLQSASVQTRVRALMHLGARKTPESTAAVARALRDENSEARQMSLWALGVIGGTEAVDALRSVQLQQEQDRLKCVDALLRAGGNAAIPALAEFLSDSSASVRQRALAALGSTREKHAIPFIRTALEHLSDQERAGAIKVLQDLGDTPH